MPQNLHILQVEQEILGDDKSVLMHVLECDEERLSLMKEQDELVAWEGDDEEIQM